MRRLASCLLKKQILPTTQVCHGVNCCISFNSTHGQLIAYADEATSAIIRQAFIPSKFAEAMSRYGPIKAVGEDEPANKNVKRCSLLSSDDNASEDRFFSDGESITSSSMTSVGDEPEPPDIAERFDNDRVQDRIECGLTVADAHEDDGKSIGGSEFFS